jgi:hypothetical protein
MGKNQDQDATEIETVDEKVHVHLTTWVVVVVRELLSFGQLCLAD